MTHDRERRKVYWVDATMGLAMRTNLYTALVLCLCVLAFGCRAQEDDTKSGVKAPAKSGQEVAVKTDGQKGKIAPAVPGEKKGTPTKGTKKKKKPMTPTEISSDSLEYDLAKQVIVFSGNVRVIDDQLHLKADKMTVTMSKKTQAVTKIIAEGRVEVKKDNGHATGDRAEYDLVKGEMVLSGEPVIHNPTGNIKGALKVIYNRKGGKFKTQGGNPRLEIINKKGGTPMDGFIDGPKKGGDKNTKKDDKTKTKDGKLPAKDGDKPKEEKPGNFLLTP